MTTTHLRPGRPIALAGVLAAGVALTSALADPQATQVNKAAKAARPAAKPAAVDPFWAEPEQAKVWDLEHLDLDGEARLGQDANRAILKLHPPITDGPEPERLEQAIEPYLKAGTRKGVQYTATALDCEGSNAFSAPGGFVYVCRGMFGWISRDEDYALEYVVLHEMAHVDLAHDVINLRDPDVKKLKIGTVPVLAHIAIPFGHTEAQELEADRWAAARMKEKGRSPYEILAYLRKLNDYAGRNGFANVKLKPDDKPAVPPIDNHLRSHPIPRKRLKALRDFLDSGRKA